MSRECPSRRSIMDEAMFTLYPAGIRVLLVDDDSRFLKTASMLLSLLNYKVSTCGCPSSALKVLTSAKEVDVVLADAKKVATCDFDFKAIIEPDLHIPVIYFLSQDHESAGAVADALLRTLDLASFILKKPFDIDDICNLWRDIAWRLCCLNTRTGGGDAGQGSSSAAAAAAGGGNGGLLAPLWAGSSVPVGDDREEEERVHFRVIHGVRGRKRKGCVAIKSPGSSSSGSNVPARGRQGGRRPAKIAEQTDVETAAHVAKRPPRKCHSKKAKKNVESARLPAGTEGMDVQAQAQAQAPQPKQSLFVKSVLHTLDVPRYNASIFADAVEPGSNVISFSGVRSNTIAVPPASPTVHQASPAPAPLLLAANPAPQAPAPALPVVHRQKQTPAGTDVAGKMAPPAAAAAATTATSSTALTDKEAVSPRLLCGAFGPFPYQGPLPTPAVQKDMFAPLNFFAIGNVQLLFQQPPIIAVDDATQHAGGDYDVSTTVSTLMQSLQFGGGAPTAQNNQDDEVAGLMATYTTGGGDPDLMVLPQRVDDVAPVPYNSAAMYYNANGQPFVEVPDHDQVLGMTYDGVSDQETAGAGAFFDENAAAFMAGFGDAAPTVNQPAAMADDPAAMLAHDGTEDDYYSFPLEALMGTDVQMYDDGGLAGLQGEGATEGVAADDDADALLGRMDNYVSGGEDSMEDWGIGPAGDGFAFFDDMLMNENTTGSDLFSNYLNNGRE